MTSATVSRLESQPLRYRAFGLTIDSDLPLPEFEPGDPQRPADLRIRLRAIDRKRPDIGRSIYDYGATEQFLYWPTVGGFLIRDANTIDIDPEPGAGESLLRLSLLGPVMALLMHAKERLVLHASAVRIGEQLAVFVGDKGAGKSTTTAAAVDRGHGLFTDDLLCVTFDAASNPSAAPGFPSVKLVNDCSGLFSLAGAEDLAHPAPDFPKRIRRLNTAFADAPAKIGCIYVLDRSDATRITPYSRGEALRMIMRFCYVPLFEGKPWEPAEARRHFTQCASLANTVRVARLETPSDLSRMSEIIEGVEHDLA